MNLEKRVFETLFKNKIDLSAQKIELSVMDDIDSKGSKKQEQKKKHLQQKHQSKKRN